MDIYDHVCITNENRKTAVAFCRMKKKPEGHVNVKSAEKQDTRNNNN